MELTLFKKDNSDWTRFKIPTTELNSVPIMALKTFGYQPTKVSNKFTYYEVKGNMLNGNSESKQNFYW